ncbi:MAG: hypothetical protein AAF658_08605 [Myxococcota bacterium]
MSHTRHMRSFVVVLLVVALSACSDDPAPASAAASEPDEDPGHSNNTNNQNSNGSGQTALTLTLSGASISSSMASVGSTVVLSVAVHSNGLVNVSANLSSLGLPLLVLRDDGSDADVTGGDQTYTGAFEVPAGLAAPAAYDLTLDASATQEQETLSETASLTLNVVTTSSVSVAPLDYQITPRSLPAGSTDSVSIEAVATASDATIDSVSVTSPGLFQAPVPLVAEANDRFRASVALLGTESPGVYEITLTVQGTGDDGTRVQSSQVAVFSLSGGYEVSTENPAGLTSISDLMEAQELATGIHIVMLPFAIEFFGRILPAGSEATLSDDGFLSFNARSQYVANGNAATYASITDATPAIAAHHNPTLIGTIHTVVTGDPGSRVWILEWNGTYNTLGSATFQLRFTEGTPGFVIHYGAMTPGAFGGQSWSMVAIDSDFIFNDVRTPGALPALESQSETRWVFTPD